MSGSSGTHRGTLRALMGASSGPSPANHSRPGSRHNSGSAVNPGPGHNANAALATTRDHHLNPGDFNHPRSPQARPAIPAPRTLRRILLRPSRLLQFRALGSAQRMECLIRHQSDQPCRLRRRRQRISWAKPRSKTQHSRIHFHCSVNCPRPPDLQRRHSRIQHPLRPAIPVSPSRTLDPVRRADVRP